MTGKSSTPGDDAEAQVFGNGNAGDEPILGVFDDEDREVDTCSEPRELLKPMVSVVQDGVDRDSIRFG